MVDSANVVLSYVRKQVEQATEGRSVSSAPPWFLPLLLLSSCPHFPQ